MSTEPPRPDAADPHAHAQHGVDTGQPIEAQYARQGRKGLRMPLVLGVSFALVVLVLIGMWALSSPGFNATEPDNARQTIDAVQAS
ncbi:hypothetical protein Q0812_06320 [Brevundimonas sp. 2R-24]|uniref:Uncharacterized protein n=1 Tax=Peiella sedimenti TaxID=3061083 RepID=A0ABT8SKM2_9CAUL|nr:hypothetical protein [Caulobacteraceae bacterium XZ-24]